jgi:hypothetical protein
LAFFLAVAFLSRAGRVAVAVGAMVDNRPRGVTCEVCYTTGRG